MSGHTHTHTHTHTYTHTYTHDNESTEVQTLGIILIQLIYSINVLSKYGSLILHRPSIFEGRHIDLRRSTYQSPIFEGRHVDHRSSKVNTSISEGRHIDLRRSTHRDIDLRKSPHRSSSCATSIFEDRRQKHHTYNSPPNIVHNCPPSP